MKLLHFSRDEKFVPLIRSVFEEAFPGGNTFRLIPLDSRLAKFTESDSTSRIVDDGYFDSPDLLNDLQTADFLIVHAMHPLFAKGILKAPSHVKVIWSGWGFDYAHLIEGAGGNLILKETLKAYEDSRPKFSFPLYELIDKAQRNAKRVLEEIILCRRGFRGVRDALEAIKERIDIYSVMPEEEAIVRRMLPGLKAKYQMLHYFTTENILASGVAGVSGRNILLGNSATPENNHVEAIFSLKKIDLSDRRIIVPLSYGDKYYASKICEIGAKVLGEKFEPLLAFMPLSEYNKVISGCSWVVMNHRRQQALGNISTSLYQGAMVFLRRENPIYSFYQEMGVSVFNIERLADFDVGAETQLSIDIRESNRLLVGEFWARKRVVESLRGLANFQK